MTYSVSVSRISDISCPFAGLGDRKMPASKKAAASTPSEGREIAERDFKSANS
jgi:hypothetical protein